MVAAMPQNGYRAKLSESRTVKDFQAAGRLEAGPAPGPGRGDGLCCEPGGGCPVLAADLTQAVDWALGTRRDPPDTAVAAVTTGIRLDEALRGYLAEQGAKRLSKEDLGILALATVQLRLTATSLASLQSLEPARHHHPGMVRAHAALEHDMADLAGFYERVAALAGRPTPHEVVLPVSVPALVGLDGNSAPY
jgi:hypothetical protein